MITRREAAQRLDIPLEMASRHGLPSRMHEDELAALEADPPAWLVQSRANRTGTRPRWATLICDICGFTETTRPKKWWPTWDYLSCDTHDAEELPPAREGTRRREQDGIGSRFIAAWDEPVDPQPAG